MDLAQNILHIDADLLAINKPSGMLSLPDGYNPEAPHLRTLFEPLYGRLWIVHRLDRETSGVVLLARNANTHRSLNTQFEQHTIRKTYHALVLGSPPWEELTTRQPLHTNVGKRHRTIVDPQLGKPAVTHLRVLERFESWALIEAVPETGRTHQIRAHLYALGLPIAGDALYSTGARLRTILGGPQLERLGLHAWLLEFTHPTSGERLALHAPYPADLADVMKFLRQQM
jgi:RluA family pseudouridine synthase